MSRRNVFRTAGISEGSLVEYTSKGSATFDPVTPDVGVVMEIVYKPSYIKTSDSVTARVFWARTGLEPTVQVIHENDITNGYIKVLAR